MPRVPGPTQPIRSTGNQTPFQQARGSSPAAFGAREAMALVRSSQGLVKAGDDLGNISLAIQKSENDRAAKEMDNEFSQRSRAILYGDDQGNPGYLNSNGQAAVQGAGGTIESLEKARAEILNGAANSRVAKDWDLSSKAEMEVKNDQIGRHAGAERVRSLTNTTEAWIENRASEALANALDPLSRERGLSEIRIGVEDLQVLNGWTDEETKNVLDGRQSQFHGQVVEQILSGDPTTAARDAQKYFDDNKDRIGGQFQADIQKKIKIVATQQTSAITREVNEAVEILSNDRDYENMAELQAQVSALGPRGAELQLRLNRAIEDRPILSAFNQLSIAARDADVDAGRADLSRNADEERVYQKKVKSLSDARIAIARGDGILLAVNNKVISDLAELQMDDPGSWAARAVQSDTASKALGASIGPLTKAEMDGLAETLVSGSLDQTTAILQAMVEGTDEDLTDQLAQDFVKDHPGVAAAIGTVQDRPEVSRLILQGEKRMAENENLIASNEDVNIEVEDLFEGLFDEASDGDTLSSLVAGARAIYAGSGDPSRNIRGDFDAGDFEDAVEVMTGGILRDSRGGKILAPKAGMTQGQFDNLAQQVTSADLVEFGSGVPVFADGSPVPPTVLDDAAELVSSGPGQYLVRIPGQGPIKTVDGDPYEVNLGAMVDQGGAELTSTQSDEETIASLGFGPAQLGVDPVFEDPSQLDVSPQDLEDPVEQPALSRTQPAEVVDKAVAQSLMRDEGFSPIPYGDVLDPDNPDKLTIGYGHVIKPGETFDKPLTLAQANNLLRKDIKEAKTVANQFSWYAGLNPVRQSVVTNMIFNLGKSGFTDFERTITAIENEDWDTAANEMLDSDWHSQVGARARRLAEQMRTGRF